MQNSKSDDLIWEEGGHHPNLGGMGWQNSRCCCRSWCQFILNAVVVNLVVSSFLVDTVVVALVVPLFPYRCCCESATCYMLSCLACPSIHCLQSCLLLAIKVILADVCVLSFTTLRLFYFSLPACCSSECCQFVAPFFYYSIRVLLKACSLGAVV